MNVISPTTKLLLSIGIILILPLGLVLSSLAESSTDYTTLSDGAALYRAACAVCHGSTGQGRTATELGFAIPMPDFTDCNFTSREPAADWVGIAHDGGPVRGFDPLMPAFGEALTMEQLKTVVDYVKSFCINKRYPDGKFNLPASLFTTKAFLEDEFVYSLSGSVGEPFSIIGEFASAKRVGAKHQFEVAIPFGWQQVRLSDTNGTTEYRWGEGVGDIGFEYKLNLFSSLRSGSIMSFATEVIVPTGDEADGLGDGLVKFEPSLLFGQLIPVLGFIQLQVGAEISTDIVDASHELFWRAVFGHTFIRGDFGKAWSPMIELLGGIELEEDAEVEWDIVPQLQVTLNTRQHIMFGLGARIPLSEFEPEKIQPMIYLRWDWFDGGFFEGW